MAIESNPKSPHSHEACSNGLFAQRAARRPRVRIPIISPKVVCILNVERDGPHFLTPCLPYVPESKDPPPPPIVSPLFLNLGRGSGFENQHLTVGDERLNRSPEGSLGQGVKGLMAVCASRSRLLHGWWGLQSETVVGG